LRLIKNVKEEHTRHLDTPTLEPDQVFCVIELYRNKQENGKSKTQNHYVSILDVSCVSIGDNPFGTEQFEIEKAVTMRGRNPYSSSMVGSEIVQEWQSRNDWESRDFFRPAPYTFSILDIKGYTMAHSEAGEELKVKAVL
jgi:hypothetical protein